MKKKLYSFLLAAFLATTSLFAAGDATSGLRMHYTFESVDTVASVPYILDQTANHLDGKVIGALALTPGYNTGKAVPLTDTAKIVEVPGNVFEDVRDFTVSFWLNQNAHTQWARIFDFGSNQDHYMFIAIDQELLRFEMDVDNDAYDLTYMAATEKLQLKRWNHVAVVGKYTNISTEDTTSLVSIYINGKLAGTSTAFNLAPYMLGNTLSHARFGDSQWPDPPLNGYLDDFRFYNRALTIEDLEAVSGITAELKSAFNALDIPVESRTNMKYPDVLTLPTVVGGMNVVWTTSDSTVVSKTGVPMHSDITITDAFLTAKVYAADGFTYLEKQFLVSVYPVGGDPIEVLADYKFTTGNFFLRHDSMIVKDEGELKSEGFVVGGAQILPIGDMTGTEGIDYFHVFATNDMATGTANKQYLNLGKSVGDYVYKLRDHTISIFYRRDTTIDHKTWSDAGQMLWAFGNHDNLNGNNGGNAYGAMYFEPNDCRVVITKDRVETIGSTAMGWGTGKTPLGNTWHNITYTQKYGVGYLVVDAVQVATGPMPAPKEELRKNSNVQTRTGTWFNFLGGTLNYDRITAKNTMLYGFKMLSYGMSTDEVEDAFVVTPTIELLNEAITSTPYEINAFLALLPALNDARATLSIGFHTPIHDELQTAYTAALLDSANKTATAAKVSALTASIKSYKELSADWVKMKGVLASFDDERALNYPGLSKLEEAIATVQVAYNTFEIETTMFADLDSAVLAYQKSQIPTAAKPANYSFYIANPCFEEGTGGTKDPGTTSTNGPDLKLPKGWTVLYHKKSAGNPYAKTGLETANNPMEGTTDFEVWSAAENNVYHTNIYQDIKEALPAGWYVLSGSIRSLEGTRGGQHMYAFSLVDSVTYKSDTLEADKPGIGWQGGYGWVNSSAAKKVFAKFQSKGERFKIGFTADTALYKMDDVKLAYFGTSEPVLGDVTSYIKNASFESGARTTELEGISADTTIKATSGDVFAPLDWKVTAAAKAPVAKNAIINVIASGEAEGSYLYKIKADTLTSVKLYQTLYAPSSGMYKLNVYLRTDSASKSDARLFSQVGRRYEEGMKLMTAVDSLDTFKGWKKMEYVFRAAVADQIDLGIVTSGNVEVDGFKLDLFSNVYVGIKGTPAISSKYGVYTKDGIIHISGLTGNDRVSVYDMAGRQISVKNPSQIKVGKGLYLVKINNDVIKQLVN